MATSTNFILFQKTLEMYNQKKVEKVVKVEEFSESESECEHDETIDENSKVICLNCGQLLGENFLIVDQLSNSAVGVKKRKRVECSIYNELPQFISQNIKDMTIDIYKLVTGEEIFRNTFRKSIILACLHRAVIIKEAPIYFDDMLEMFGLTTHEANKGITFVANNIPKDSEYTIPFFNDELSIMSVLASTS